MGCRVYGGAEQGFSTVEEGLKTVVCPVRDEGSPPCLVLSLRVPSPKGRRPESPKKRLKRLLKPLWCGSFEALMRSLKAQLSEIEASWHSSALEFLNLAQRWGLAGLLLLAFWGLGLSDVGGALGVWDLPGA